MSVEVSSCGHAGRREKYIVIADDFTGANDLGVQFATAGYQVDVWLDKSRECIHQDSHSVSVFCSNSRDISSLQAYDKLTALGEQVPNDASLIKKIDSTMRGNIGAEIEALLNATGRQVAIVAPAAPSIGRTTQNGVCYVDGIPLIDTEFASDPKSPVSSSDIKMIISNQTELRIANVAGQNLQADTLAKQLDALVKQGCQIVVLDADCVSDLQEIVAATEQLSCSSMLVGASDLALAITGAHESQQPYFSQLLAVVGSMSAVTQQQIRQAATHSNVRLLPVTAEQLLGPERNRVIEELSQSGIDALSAGKHVIAYMDNQSDQRHQMQAFAAKYQLTRSGIGDAIKSALAEMTRRIVTQNQAAAIYLSGGDVALAAAEALEAQGFSLEGQLVGCVPWGRFIGGVASHRLVLTKAGAFGDSHTLYQILHMIEETHSD